MCRLIRLRNSHPAFGGEFGCAGGGTTYVAKWVLGAERIELVANVAAGAARLSWTEDGALRSVDDLRDLPG